MHNTQSTELDNLITDKTLRQIIYKLVKDSYSSVVAINESNDHDIICVELPLSIKIPSKLAKQAVKEYYTHKEIWV